MLHAEKDKPDTFVWDKKFVEKWGDKMIDLIQKIKDFEKQIRVINLREE